MHAQSRLTLFDLRDCSPPGSSVPGILQARITEWRISFCFSLEQKRGRTKRLAGIAFGPRVAFLWFHELKQGFFSLAYWPVSLGESLHHWRWGAVLRIVNSWAAVMVWNFTTEFQSHPPTPSQFWEHKMGPNNAQCPQRGQRKPWDEPHETTNPWLFLNCWQGDCIWSNPCSQRAPQLAWQVSFSGGTERR